MAKVLRFRYTFAMLSVSEFAREANLSTARVRTLAASGQLLSKKLGNQWIILSSPAERVKLKGRPLSQHSFDDLALLLDNKERDLSSDRKRRARVRVSELGRQGMDWVERHIVRADETVKTYVTDSSTLKDLALLKDFAPTGTSNDSTHVFGGIIHAYVPLKKLRRVELVYQLREAPLSESNVVLRAVDVIPPMSTLRLVCDLAYERDVRATTEAARMLEGLLESVLVLNQMV